MIDVGRVKQERPLYPKTSEPLLVGVSDRLVPPPPLLAYTFRPHKYTRRGIVGHVSCTHSLWHAHARYWENWNKETAQSYSRLVLSRRAPFMFCSQMLYP